MRLRAVLPRSGFSSRWIAGLLAVWSISMVASCDVSGPVPAYVYVDEFELTVKQGEGTASERITEGWFFANQEFLGAYTLPAVIPVVAEGSTSIRVSPGIKVNGIVSSPDIYDFYERYDIELDLAPGRVDSVFPVTSYTDFAEFAFLEDFEVSNAFIDNRDNNPDTKVELIENEEVFEGNRSGYIRLDVENDFIDVASLPILTDLPTNNSNVFLEFNYKTNTLLGLGLVGSGQGFPGQAATIIILTEKEDWNKIYIDLSGTLFASQLDGYQIRLTAQHSNGANPTEIYLDNFKIINIDQ